MASCTAEQVAHPTSLTAPEQHEGPPAGVTVILSRPDIPYTIQPPNMPAQSLTCTLHMSVEVHQDPDSETRLLAEANTFITVSDMSEIVESVSKVYFSIFSGKPSQCFPGVDQARTKWLQEWHTARLTDARLKTSGATREHVLAIRCLYNKDGTLMGPGKKVLAGPHENDTLIYISKIVTEPRFAGKGLLKPMLDLLYQSVTHKDLSPLCQISGPICWILEPGFIISDENEKMWPLLPGEEECDRCYRVAQTLKTKVYPKVGYTVYRDDVKVPGIAHYTHTYMGRRLYAHPRQDGAVTCELEPLPSEYPALPETPASATQNGKRKRSDAFPTSTETQDSASPVRSPPKKKKSRPSASVRDCITVAALPEEELNSGTSFMPINRPSQNSRASQRSQPRIQSIPSSSSSRTTTSGSRQARSSSSRAGTVPPKRRNPKRKVSERDDEHEIEFDGDHDDDEYEYCAAGDDDDDGDEFVPPPSLARTVRRPAGQPSEGARPTRRNCKLGGVDIEDYLGELAMA